MPHSLVLETDFETADGVARVTDCMPLTSTHPRVVRVVEGIRGTVAMEMLMSPRFDYGKTKPWIHKLGEAIEAGAGPSAVELRGHVPLRAHDFHASAEFSIREGERVGFVLSSHPSWEAYARAARRVRRRSMQTDAWWREWAGRSTYDGRWAEEVERSLITLKALTFAPTGGIVAAATTSLPEFLGGVRNWDYRFCWLRDAALTLDALMTASYVEEATSWRDWVVRAVAGDPEDIQIMYGLGGERRLDEYELPHLDGYEGSAPVRIGNAASGQLQLDVYGELIDAIYQAHELGMPPAEHAQTVARHVIRWLEEHWQDPDDGVWEVRGGRKQFVHSKVMAWVAVDRVLKFAKEMELEQEVDNLTKLATTMHEEICREGYDAKRNTFTQYYGSTQLDASLLLIPQVGFLPPEDPRVDRDRRGDPAGPRQGRLRDAVHPRRRCRRRPATGRGCVPRLQLLARDRPRDDRPARRSGAAVRSARLA